MIEQLSFLLRFLGNRESVMRSNSNDPLTQAELEATWKILAPFTLYGEQLNDLPDSAQATIVDYAQRVGILAREDAARRLKANPAFLIDTILANVKNTAFQTEIAEARQSIRDGQARLVGSVNRGVQEYTSAERPNAVDRMLRIHALTFPIGGGQDATFLNNLLKDHLKATPNLSADTGNRVSGSKGFRLPYPGARASLDWCDTTYGMRHSAWIIIEYPGNKQAYNSPMIPTFRQNS